MNFEEYLISKKIDSAAFQNAEPALFQAWRLEFDQMHVNSFTLQKLNLINPVRRKYQLTEKPADSAKTEAAPASNAPAPTSPPRVTRPVIKPKMN